MAIKRIKISKVARQQKLFNKKMNKQEKKDTIAYLDEQIENLDREINLWNQTLKQKMVMRESLMYSKEKLKTQPTE